MDPLKFTITFLAILATILLTSAWLLGTEPIAPSETQEKLRHISIDGSSFHVEIITIDGMEYIVASTYHGVGICRKH